MPLLFYSTVVLEQNIFVTEIHIRSFLLRGSDGLRWLYCNLAIVQVIIFMHSCINIFRPWMLENKTPSKGSTQFVGTQEKCVACGKTVYPLEKVKSYHILMPA